MATYLILNTIFMLVIIAAFRARPEKSLSWLTMLAVLLALTAVFDSVIIGLDIVAYDTGKLLGVYIGNAPIEDFFYTFLAALIMPAFWHRFKRTKNE